MEITLLINLEKTDKKEKLLPTAPLQYAGVSASCKRNFFSGVNFLLALAMNFVTFYIFSAVRQLGSFYSALSLAPTVGRHFKDDNDLTRTTKILNIIYGLTVALFLLDSLTSFDIKSQSIKTFVYLGLLVGTPMTLIWNFLVIKTKTTKIIATVFPAIILTLILIKGPMAILFTTGAWRTQTILYQNGHLSFKTIEFQMLDAGALGYCDRTVEVFYLTPFFMFTSEVPKDIDKRVEWVKVDKEVNELGLTYP